MMRILVTGGAGFIGSHLVERCLTGGHTVVVIDSFVTSSPENLAHLRDERRLRVIRSDVRDAPLGRYDRVYHLASPASPNDYERLPVETLLANSAGTHRALEVARRGRSRFLLASTSEVYGDPLEHPQHESYWGNVDPIGPRSAYDEGKRFAEALTVAYVRARSVNARIARIFNTYGPRMRPDDGRMPSEFIVRALRGEPLPVHAPGTQTRSLCYVSDTVDGLVAAMERGRPDRVYNVGRPDEMTVRAFAEAVIRAVGSSRITVVRGRPGDIARRRPDVRRARCELGWHAAVTLDEGLRRTIEWYRSRPTRSRPRATGR